MMMNLRHLPLSKWKCRIQLDHQSGMLINTPVMDSIQGFGRGGGGVPCSIPSTAKNSIFRNTLAGFESQGGPSIELPFPWSARM